MFMNKIIILGTTILITVIVVQYASAVPELTIFQKGAQVQQAIPKSKNLNELLIIADEWDKDFRKAMSVYPNEPYVTDRDKIVDYSIEKLLEEGFEKALEIYAPMLIVLMKNIPRSLSVSWAALEVMSPSDTASDAYQLVELDKTIQRMISKKIKAFLPPKIYSLQDQVDKTFEKDKVTIYPGR